MKRLFLIIFLCLCLSPAVFAADGWASMNGGTTGGAGGTEVIIKTPAELIQYCTNSGDTPYIITIAESFTITGGEGWGGGAVYIHSNKTIQGLPGVVLTGTLDLGAGGTSNVIIQNLTITNPASSEFPTGIGRGDGITCWAATNIFITHCTIFDCADGCCDITRASDYITVSWCKFYYTDPDADHRLTMITGNDSTAHPRTTLHHNWWAENCDQRMPSGSYCSVHMYNNYFSCAGNDYCSNGRSGSQMLSENNYYETVDNPIDVRDGGLLKTSGNKFYRCTGSLQYGDDIVFTPPYSYALNNVYRVPEIVRAGAGADGIDPVPHWTLRNYGDFDLNHYVDIGDFAAFSEYWLAVNDIWNADYYANGRVDVNEFALFASNWQNDERPDSVINYADQSCRTDSSNPTSNAHDASKLTVYTGGSGNKAWVKFDIGDLDVNHISGAVLRVTLAGARSGTCYFDVSAVNDDCITNINWHDRNLTWNNAPGNLITDLALLDSTKTTYIDTINFTNGAAGQQFFINVLPYLQADTDRIIQFVLHNCNSLTNFATHDNPSGEAYWPALFITYSY
ncbi:MAG: DNRLRE domain-containing protein [Phycisphaerae bacterium]|nr:DNRLRE domain-containing protein [Phycisphaerae bacterium]